MIRCLRLASIAMLAIALPGAGPANAPADPEIAYPDSAPGQHAAAFFVAYNADSDAAMRRFYETHVSEEGRKRRPVAERLGIYRQMREAQGRLTPLETGAAGETSLEVIARNQRDERVSLTFLCEDEPPHGLMGIRLEDLGSKEDAQAQGVGAASEPSMTEAEIVKALRAHLESLRTDDAFSGAVLLAKGKTPLFREAYGLASRPDRVPNRPDTKFNLGSINKTFTRIAIEQLARDGRLRLTDTIDRWVPEYPADKGRRITIAQLLEMRGGVPDIFSPAYQAADRSKLRDIKDWIPLFRDEPLRFEPGTREQYSNGGYVLLGRAIETASGRSYYDYVRERIYAPAGMKDTDSFFRDEAVPNRAIGYTRSLGGGGASLRDAGGEHPARGSSAGGGYSTVDDLLRFSLALREGRFGDGTGKAALGIAGGSPGTNAVLETMGDYTAIVLANCDPPAAEHLASKIRGWLRRSSAAAAGSADPDDPARKPHRTEVPSSGVDVPMRRSGHLPAVEVMLNGKGPFLFAIDTGGAGTARVNSALASRLGLPAIGEVHAGDPSGKNVQTLPLVGVESIEIGAARFTGLSAAARPQGRIPPDENAEGVLGFGLFADCLFTLDYSAGRIRLGRGELPSPNGKEVLEFRERHGVPSVRLRVGGLDVDADLDTGSMGGFSFPESLAAELELASEPKVVGRARTMNNSFDIKAAQLDGEIALGGHLFQKPTVEFQPIFPVANVGARILGDLSLTFDQKNRRVRIERGRFPNPTKGDRNPAVPGPRHASR